MPQIGVRELKVHASKIIQAVRDRRARYYITYRGRPVGVLMPVGEVPLAETLPDQGADVWAELERLGEEIGRGWQSPQSSADLLSKMRR